MAVRRSPTRTPAKSGATPLPKGSRIPRPALILWIVRGVFIGALVLTITHQWLFTWANTYAPAAPTSQIRDSRDAPADSERQPGLLTRALTAASSTRSADGTGEDKNRDTVAPIIAAAIRAALTRPVITLSWFIGNLGGIIMIVESGMAMWGMRQQARTTPRIPITYMLVRATMPAISVASGRMAGSSTPNGDQFFRAIQQAVPRGSWQTRLNGTAPWIAFTLTGLPDKPVEMGFVVADPDARRRADTAMAIRTIIQGQLPGAQIDEVLDPFLAALQPGVRVVWRDYGLKLPPQYPLRFLDDIAGSDLLGPLVAAVAPHGTLRTEAQIVLRPANRWSLNWGWRGDATALLLNLQARNDYALTEDTKVIEAKLDAAPFEATIRIGVMAEGPQADVQLMAALNQIADVLGQYHQRTSHHLQTLVQIGVGKAQIAEGGTPLPLHTRAPRFAPLPAFVLPLRTWRIPDIITSIEIAGFWHPPSGGLGQLVRWLPCKVIQAPPHAYIAPGRTDRIMVGMAKRADGTIGPVGPTLRDLRPPLHITSGMGGGKSRALANICNQCVPYGHMLLDGKGDDQGGSLAATVRGYIPMEDEQRLIIFDILDTDWPIGLNPLSGIDLKKPGAKDQALGQIMAIFARLDPTTWGKAPAMKEFVQMATLLVLEGEKNPTLAHVKQCLLDVGYREKLIPHCTNPDVLTFWMVTFPAQGEQQRTSLHALLRRFSQLLTTETTRYMVSQPASRLNLLEAIERGMIVLAPLPHVTLGDLASAIGMLLLQQFVRAALSRPGDDQTRSTFPLIIDELQVFIGAEGNSTDLQTAITQLRGLGIAGIYAHQTLNQLGELEDEMLTNSGSRLVLRTQEPDASTYARLYAASGITAADISDQDENEHQYAVLRCDGQRTGLFSMIVLPWPRPLQVPVEPYDGPDWQTLTPPDSPDPAFDRALMQIVYQAQKRPATLVRDMAEYPEALWQKFLARWEAIRAYHRQYIIDHPGCIAIDERIIDPDTEVQAAKRADQQRKDRQMWLSRLLVATPRVLAAAEYARIRHEIEPEDRAGNTDKNGKSGKGGHTERNGQRSDLVYQAPHGSEQAGDGELKVIGHVAGASPAPNAIPPTPIIVESRTADEVLQERGERRTPGPAPKKITNLDADPDTEA